MAIDQDFPTAAQPQSRQVVIFDGYMIGLSVIMMLLGLRQWAIILGILSGPEGGFEAMPTAWQIATMHLAVADLVAAVGLWMRVAWGKVIWVYAALSQIAMHTVFIGTFGGNLMMVLFLLVLLVAFVVLAILARRSAHP
jgi:hypothetical protein